MSVPANPVSIGGSTKKSDYDILYNNALLADTGGTPGGLQTIPGQKQFTGGLQGKRTANIAVCGCTAGNCGVYGQAVCYGVYGCATGCFGVKGEATAIAVQGLSTGNCGGYFCSGACVGVLGRATTCGVYGCVSGNVGVFGVATGNCGVVGCACGSTGSNGCYGVWGQATCRNGVFGCATTSCGVSGRSYCIGVYGCATDTLYGVYGAAQTCYGIFGTAVTARPVAGNGAYYDSTSSKFIKLPKENICITKCLMEKPLSIYKWVWEDENQRGFDYFVAPYAQDFQNTFGLTKDKTGYYEMGGLSLKLGIELLQEINFLKKRVSILEGE